MKKMVFLLLAILSVTNVQAEKGWCGYRDYFHLEDEGHPGVHISWMTVTQEVAAQQLGPRSFEIRDTMQCTSGYVHVMVAYSDYNWCALRIKDGPYMMHPSVNATCSGMNFRGVEYDGFHSYSYTIKLD